MNEVLFVTWLLLYPLTTSLGAYWISRSRPFPKHSDSSLAIGIIVGGILQWIFYLTIAYIIYSK